MKPDYYDDENQKLQLIQILRAFKTAQDGPIFSGPERCVEWGGNTNDTKFNDQCHSEISHSSESSDTIRRFLLLCFSPRFKELISTQSTTTAMKNLRVVACCGNRMCVNLWHCGLEVVES